MSRVLFFDSTLRDGSHAVAHQISTASIREYCRAVDDAGLHTVIVGHGNGLGASSIQVGLAKHTDEEMLKTARKELKKTRLGVFCIPGFATITDHLEPAMKIGVDLVCVASHCTEADITRQHIEYSRKKGKEVYGVLMMYHMIDTERLLEEALKMQSYGAQGIILMDSAGASTPDLVKETITTLVKNLSIPVGFHAHNNLGISVSNTLLAIESGATIVDGTLRGFGPGSGNLQLEVMAGLLKKLGYDTGLDLYKLLDASDLIVTKILDKTPHIDGVSLISGMAGVFSAFAPKVRLAAAQFDVDPRDIFIELGKLKVVAGQEDFVVDVAHELAKKKGGK